VFKSDISITFFIRISEVEVKKVTMLTESFISKVGEIRENKQALVSLMNEIDESKRQVKARLTAISSGRKEFTELSTKERRVQIKKMQDKLVYLAEEREYIRSLIGEINRNIKAVNRAKNSRKEAFCHAFLAAAEDMLDEETFLALESKAAVIMSIRE